MSCDSELLRKQIETSIDKDPHSYQAYNDMLDLVRIEKRAGHRKYAYEISKDLKTKLIAGLNTGASVDMLLPIYKETLRVEAYDNLDSYLLYLEFDREPKDRFYQPRRRTLFPVVRALQMLADDELDELFLSMPPRIGKSCLIQMFVTWVIGKNSELSNLYCSYSKTITASFFNGLLEVLTDEFTYNWNKVFTTSRIVGTNAAENTIDINRRKKYHTVTSRSIDGSLNGSCDCNGFLIADDLVSGIEEALNPERMMKLQAKVDNDLLTRKKQGAKILWIGTRWSMVDPIGNRIDLLETDQRFNDMRIKILNLPALNANDESNFDYDYGVGFDSKYYIQRRASFEKNNDIASWNAQYMQQPVEREGTLFTPNDFRFYNGILPEIEPDRIFMAVDPSFGGGDFVAAPVCLQYGDDIYIADCVYNNGDKRITIPLLVNAIAKWGVTSMQVEASKSTEGYKTDIEKELKDRGIRINLTMKPASTRDSKVERIYSRAPEIRESMIFLEPDKREKHYEQFMQNVYSFKYFARRQHDDAPDSLAQAMDMVRTPSRKPQIFKRTF